MKHLLLIAVCCLVWAFPGFGQTPVTGCFNIYNSLGQPDSVFCVGDVVFARNCFPCAVLSNTRYDFGAGAGLLTDSTYTYNTPGLYTVEQRGTDCIGVSYLLRKVNHIRVVLLPPPVFTVDICTGNKVRVKITDNNYDQYVLNYGDATPTVTLGPGDSDLHTYAAAGTYTITVEALDIESGCRGTSTQTITTLPSLPPVSLTRVEIVNQPVTNGSTRFTFTATAGYKFGIYFRTLTGTYQLIDSVQATATGLQNYLHTPVNNTAQGCYQIKVIDACPNSIVPVSNQLCTVTATATALNQSNQVTWQSYPAVPPGLLNYRVKRNGTVVATLPAGTTSLTDNNVICGRTYCYTVEAVTNGNFISVSNPTCVTAISNQAPPIAALHSSFNFSNTIEVSLFVPFTATFSQLHPIRSTNGGAFLTQANQSLPAYTDTDTSATTLSYCYRATYTDSCGNRSDTSNVTCPIIMSGQMLQQSNYQQQVVLTWSAYVGYRQGVRLYEVEILDNQFQLLASRPAGTLLNFTDDNVPQQSQVLYYRIKANPVSTNEPVVYSNLRRFVQELRFIIPTAFTPNGDNLNDVFEVKGDFFKEYELQVINRTGQIVFKSTETRRGWDGTVNGKPVPSDTFAYQFRATDSFGRVFTRSGTVTLLR